MCAEKLWLSLHTCTPEVSKYYPMQGNVQKLFISPGWVQEKFQNSCRSQCAIGLLGYSPFLNFLLDFLKLAELLCLQCYQ